ncbi:hypothetical protein [Shimia aestuarii]|uniref:Uncharacterized protein n=1 Tax=Shimia aestuarii TaxID=254406 RepID=A0A1I4IYJ3_9RHOB|nr:hypothetical protein [Shimia aestuarii]SFL59419.1 hypothetical protein SAMN04488042_101796 [Shimia aestuarii]
MSFVRPEARAAMMRWREALLGLAVLLLGLWWASGFGLLKWLGYGVTVLGVIFIIAGIQRARFRSGQGGPGVVQVDEGAVIYFGPLDGGSVAMRDLTRLALDGRSHPAVWVLSQAGQAPLMIPVNAKGSDALFDAFATLPGLKTEAMLARLQEKPDHPVVIWQKSGVLLH